MCNLHLRLLKKYRKDNSAKIKHNQIDLSYPEEILKCRENHEVEGNHNVV